jgi:hypothetical protein
MTSYFAASARGPSAPTVELAFLIRLLPWLRNKTVFDPQSGGSVTEEYENYDEMEEAARRLLREWQDEEPASDETAAAAQTTKDEAPEDAEPGA